MKSWLVRQIRGWLPDNNPLRRGSDRAGALIGIWVVWTAAAAMVIVPPAVSHLAANSAATLRHAQISSRHRVTAVLLEQATEATSDDGYLQIYGATARARWTYPHRQQRTGVVVADVNLPAGARVPIWVDETGDVTSPPLAPSQVAATADLAAMGTILGIATVALCTGLGAKRLLDRRRMAAWEAGWADADQRWHHQRW
jgi:hypothetical protein